MSQQPFVPRSRTNPVGQTKRMMKAKRATNKRLKTIEKALLRRWSEIPVVVQNGRSIHNSFYDYQISLDILQVLMQWLSGEFGEVGQDVLAEQIRQAYREGTSKGVDNLARIADDYTRTLTAVLRSRPWQRRASLLVGRAFELMEGFSGDSTADLGRILYQAVMDGVNPKVVAKEIRRRFGIYRRRAERISRTEITGALRRGYWDETREAQELFGINTKIIHVSALIPGRTRVTHAQRHGSLHTVAEQAAWYAKDGNAINCLCSQSSVVVDDDGKPLVGQKLLKRMAEQRKAFISKGAGTGTG